MRLFIAIELSSEARAELERVQSQLKHRGFSELSYTKPEQLHLTLKFLGEIDEQKAGILISCLNTVALANEPFSLCLAATGFFPERGTPRVVWVSVEGPAEPGALLKVWRDSEKECIRAGFPAEDRPFSPHITLARVKDQFGAKRLPKVLSEVSVAKIEMKIEDVKLFQSVLKPTGAVHTIIHEARFSTLIKPY